MCPYIFYTFPLGTTKQLVLELIPSYEQVMVYSLELAAAVAATAAVQATVACSSKTAATAAAEAAGDR